MKHSLLTFICECMTFYFKLQHCTVQNSGLCGVCVWYDQKKICLSSKWLEIPTRQSSEHHKGMCILMELWLTEG